MTFRRALIAFGLLTLAASAQAQVVPQPGPPTNMACAYNTTPVTLTNGQAGWIQCDANGNLLIAGTITASLSGTGANNADNVAAVATGLTPSVAYNYVWDGAAWDRLYGDSTNGLFANIKAMIALPANTAQTYIGNVNTQGTKATYRAATGAPAIDGAGVLLQIQGSGTKTIRVTRVVVGGNLTVTSNGLVTVQKYSTAVSGGTSAAVTGTPLDSASSAATAAVLRWTAVGTTGSLIGAVGARKSTWTADTLANSAEAVFTFGDLNGQALVLRGTAEYLAVSTSGFGSYTGATYTVEIEWTEE